MPSDGARRAARCRTSWRHRRAHPHADGRRGSSGGDGATLIGFLASHVSTAQRLELLRQALASIDQQTRPIRLYASWSATPELERAVEREFIRRTQRIRAVHQDERCSQYEHLHSALAMALHDAESMPGGVWCCFCDDDDLWHPQRAAVYAQACAHAPEDVTGLSLGVHAQPTTAACAEPRTADEVDVMLSSRAASLRYTGGSEVFLLAVRLPFLARFFEAAPRSVLRNRYADSRFTSYVHRQHGQTFRHLPPSDVARLAGGLARGRRGHDCWMYYYRKAPDADDDDDLTASPPRVDAARVQDQASTCLMPSAADAALARELLPAGMPEEVVAEMALGASALRDTVEMCALMCLHLSNAAEIALALCEHMDPDLGLSEEDVARGSPARAICQRLAREALCTFEHRPEALPAGTLEDILSGSTRRGGPESGDGG